MTIMAEDEFWSLIGRSLENASSSGYQQEEAMLKILLELEPETILAYRSRFDERMDVAFSWDIWGVAYIIDGGCSDDSFEYFLYDLIAGGREKFENALQDAESIANWAVKDSVGLEGFGYLAGTAYTQKTGQDFYQALKAMGDKRHQPTHGGKPRGEEWDEDAATLATRFPKAWAKFGW